MKCLVIICSSLFLFSCGHTTKLAIPSKFSEQADMLAVKGARSRHVSFGKYSTSKIKRGWLTKSSRYGDRFFSENLLLNMAGIQKNEIISREKDKFRFTLTNGQSTLAVQAQEFRGNKSVDFRLRKGTDFFHGFGRLQQYQYLLSATIITDTSSVSWQMVLGNYYDRREDTTKSIFTIVDNADEGFATNGKDTVIIRPLNLQKAVGPNGKEANIPIKILSGYELRIDDGVAGIVDNIGKNVWFYKELDEPTRLILAAIATTILVKRLKDVKW